MEIYLPNGALAGRTPVVCKTFGEVRSKMTVIFIALVNNGRLNDHISNCRNRSYNI